LLEGLSLVIRECFEVAQESSSSPSTCGLCGGGANSDVWCQMIADVTGTPTSRPVDQEVGTKGAFIVGLVALGIEPDFASATKRYVHVRDVFEPNGERHTRYDELFGQFLAVREAALPIWKRMATDRTARMQKQ
jgi:erythritol kinase (D-erythritol 1-phosphate-forming)